MKPVRWGILGTANIAKGVVIPAMKQAENTILYAIAGRSKEKAETFQEEFAFEKVYDRYEDLLQDPMVDAVYIPLPNHLHKEWTIKAIHQGKHVLCEKPMSGSKEDTIKMIEAARQAGVVLMEAYAYLHSPYIAAIKKEIKEGVIGEIQLIESVFYTQGYQEDIRIHKETLGGALYDLGCYNTSLILHLMETAPVNIAASAIFNKEGVDELCLASFEFANGVKASNNSGMCTGGSCGSRFFVYGTEGYIEAPVIFNQSGRMSYRIYQHNELKRTETMDVPNNYSLEVEQMNRCIAGEETPAVSHQFSILVAETDDRILRKIKY